MRKTILTAALLCAFLGTQAQEYYEAHIGSRQQFIAEFGKSYL